jgi:hypothetical protein
MKVYASMQYLEETNEWINIAIGEDGTSVLCLTYDDEAKCKYEMVEEAKIRLNGFYAENCLPVDYQIIVVESDDPRLRNAMLLQTKKEHRNSKLFFRIYDAICIRLLKYGIKVLALLGAKAI